MTDEIIKEQEMQKEQKPLPEKVEVVDIHFRSNNKVYFFSPGKLKINSGDHVIIDTARGQEFGYCAGGNHMVSSKEIVPPLRKVIRIANERDERINAENEQKEKKAMEVCQQKVAEHDLDMQLVSAECAFDGSKIVFYFTSEGRVDFRELVKNLASVFRTRIELRQIGVRDKAKMVGGLGICGRPFCCKEFLDDFQPVSIKMAKTQNLSLNPTKISGTCGRLMCCLKYEQDAYEDLIKTSPKNESFVDTVDGRGTVIDVNLLRQTVRVRMEDEPEKIGCYKNCDICVLRNGKAKKTDPPIPKDLAPISSKAHSGSKFIELPDEPMPEVTIKKKEPVEIKEEHAEKEETGEKTANRRRRRRKPAGQKPASEQQVKTQQEQPKPQKAKVRGEGKPEGSKNHHHRRRRRPGGSKSSGEQKSE